MSAGGSAGVVGAAPALDVRITISVGEGSATFTVRPEISLDAGVIVLFGPSGSGKTLTLRAVAGLLRPTEGAIRAGGEALFDGSLGVNIPAHLRRIGYVPQEPSLFPFATVVENVAFGLPRRDRRRSPAILALMRELGIDHLTDARPSSLSGGERQRVALARALAVSPRLLLLDEPFAAIDRAGRSDLRRALKEALAKHGTPAVFVTHDEEEALDLGDKMVLLERGSTVAAGTPASVLRRGKSIVISGTIGERLSPLEDGRVRAEISGAVVEGPAEALAPGTIHLDCKKL